MWGLVFVAPLLLPDYPAALLSVGRYLAFGLIALPLAWLDRARIRELARADWIEAGKLAAIGNLLYYVLLAAAIQRAGGPLPTMIIGTLPVVIAITSNLRDARRDGRLPWLQLAPSLLLIAAGIALVNHVELAELRARADVDLARHGTGRAAGRRRGRVLDVVSDPQRRLAAHARAAQPAHVGDRAGRGDAAAGRWRDWRLLFVADAVVGIGFPLPLGTTPERFIGLMLAIGLLASWLGTLCWNEASQRLPTALAGQLIVFETLAALAYAFVLRGRWPPAVTLAGIALLVVGVMWALRVRPEPIALEPH